MSKASTAPMKASLEVAGTAPATDAARIVICDISPSIENGRFPAKGVVGEALVVSATVFMDGHGVIGTQVAWQGERSGTSLRLPMKPMGNDRWMATLTPEVPDRYRLNVEAWHDGWGTYRGDLSKKVTAGVFTATDIAEGRALVQAGALRARGAAKAAVDELVKQLQGLADAQAGELFLSDATSIVMSSVDERRFFTWCVPELVVDVERRAAGFASWYELFPRSVTNDPHRHGTFADVMTRLPAIRDMGFDVLYFPPIHPIGRAHRKGRNNSLVAGPDDPGSPYAIGNADGGHDAIHPELGSPDDFRRLVKAAAEHQLEIALDFAIQCSPDHPWLAEHPGWFSWLPDGSIRYAENPPKKYEDIVNVDFYGPQAQPGLWIALRDVVEHWVREGVKTFRVDNPHTKPLPFWEWLIADVRSRHPEVLFLAEAFTRPAMMLRLGQVGFSQSYTYFTWRHTKAELTQYLTELNAPPLSHAYRPNFFVNTPDINPPFLQASGRPGFLIRAALATMGSGLWGMYSGFEICEAAPVPGKEEYLDSEKYEIKARGVDGYWGAPGNIVAEIAQLNRIRRANPALQTHLGVRFYNAWNDHILYFGKATVDRSNFVLVAVNLDPFNAQEADFELPLWELGLPDDATSSGEDLMSGHRWQWQGKHQHMRIEPWQLPFGIWRFGKVAGQ